jgi:hypothetical protein
VDHSFTFGASENIAHFNLDFNFTKFLIGRPTASGFDENQQLALAFSHVIHGGLQFAGEFYGATQLNKTTPAFASSLWALTYTVLPRLVIDGGFEAGLTSGGPQRHAFVGATYSIANLYHALRKRSRRCRVRLMIKRVFRRLSFVKTTTPRQFRCACQPGFGGRISARSRE